MTINIIRERHSTQGYVGAIFDNVGHHILHRNMWGRYSIRPTSRPPAISYTGICGGDIPYVRHLAPGDIIHREKMGATFHTSDISPPGDFSDVSNFAPRRYLLGEASFQDTDFESNRLQPLGHHASLACII